MLRDRVPSWALEVCCPRGDRIPLSPLLFWRQPGAMFLGDRRSPVPHCPCSSWVQSNHKPPTPSYYLYEGRCIRCPGFTLWQSTSLKRTRRSSAVSLEVLERSTKGEQIRN